MPDPELLRRTDYPVLRPIPTRWADNDAYGHVNNVVYFSYFDTAVNGWLMEATGLDIRRLPAIGLVVETSCVFHASLSFPRPVTAGIALERLGTSSITYRLGLFDGDNDAPAASGRFIHVYVDAGSRASTPIPPEIRSVVQGQLT